MNHTSYTFRKPLNFYVIPFKMCFLTCNSLQLRKPCCINNTFSIITDDVTCQTKCQVTINDIDGFINLLAKIELRFGYEMHEYEPCRITFLHSALNMNITCPALWDKGKFIQVNFKCPKYLYRYFYGSVSLSIQSSVYKRENFQAFYL